MKQLTTNLHLDHVPLKTGVPVTTLSKCKVPHSHLTVADKANKSDPNSKSKYYNLQVNRWTFRHFVLVCIYRYVSEVCCSRFCVVRASSRKSIQGLCRYSIWGTTSIEIVRALSMTDLQKVTNGDDGALHKREN